MIITPSDCERLIPAFLRNSAINALVVFDKDGSIKTGNDLFYRFFTPVFNITECFNYLENALFSGILQKLQVSNKTIEFFSSKNQQNFNWEISLLEQESEELFIGTIVKLLPCNEIIIDSLEERTQLFNVFLNNSPGSAWVTDKNGTILMMNNAFREMVGFYESANTGRTLWDLFPPQMADAYHKNNLEVLALKRAINFEENYVDAKGATRSSLVYKFPLSQKRGSDFIGGWSMDITEHKDATKKLQEHNDRLKEIAYLQSHEIRRPLSNIVGLSELMNIYYEQKEYNYVGDVIKLLNHSTSELDNLIRHIVNKTAGA